MSVAVLHKSTINIIGRLYLNCINLIKFYKFLSACLINSSKVIPEESCKITCMTFSIFFLENPNTSKADNASILIVLFEGVNSSEIS